MTFYLRKLEHNTLKNMKKDIKKQDPMLISNLVKELKTWSLRSCENVKPFKIKKSRNLCKFEIW
jgi:hypothetical protein